MKTNGMRRVLAAAALVLAAGPGFAHTDAVAQHGGTLGFAGELAFELVAQPQGAAVYVLDHGKPFATDAMKGTLTVLNGTQKAQAALAAAGGNRLEARGVEVGKGSKAVAALTLANGKTLSVRFSVK